MWYIYVYILYLYKIQSSLSFRVYSAWVTRKDIATVIKKLFCSVMKDTKHVMLLLLLHFGIILLLQLLLHLKTFKSDPMLFLFILTEHQPFVTIVEKCCGDWCVRDSNVKVSYSEMGCSVSGRKYSIPFLCMLFLTQLLMISFKLTR